MDAGPEKYENLERLERKISETEGEPDIVITPEYMMGMKEGKVTKDLIDKNSENMDSKYVSTARNIAKERSVALLTTAYITDGGKTYNTSIFIDKKGEILGTYRKIHLFDAFGHKESELFTHGAEVNLIDWRGLKVGLATCFDVRFPELFRIMNFRGADLVLMPSGFYDGEYKSSQWRTLINARAHENNFFVAGINHPKPHFVGNSMVSSPLGYEMVRLGGAEEVGLTEIEPAEIAESEKKMPTKEMAQFDLYKKFPPYKKK